ncbi:hypothetical protein [Castellaniella sp.]|uniref:hypothetical protein n=1 Tax=Castellaniella sp. TaxID=1955812 RepID=UPI002AFF34C0|nr:hypothetical protein [Castellaniella sp.]
MEMNRQSTPETPSRGRGARKTDMEKLAHLVRKAEELREQMRRAEKARADRRCILAGSMLLDAAAQTDAHGDVARGLLLDLLPTRLKPADIHLFSDVLSVTAPVQRETF